MKGSKTKITTTLLFIIIFNTCFAQFKKEKNLKYIIPAGLMTGGLLLVNSNINNKTKSYFKTNFKNWQSKLDDYIQYIPIAELYTANLLNIKARHNALDQTKILLISELITSGICHTIKATANITRPDGNKFSFPSGHTSQAFVCAHVLYNEYKDYNITLAYSGYLFATSTGIYRMINNRHWLSDVLFGAGLSFLVVNLTYKFKHLFINDNKNKMNLTILPSIGFNNLSLNLGLKF